MERGYSGHNSYFINNCKFAVFVCYVYYMITGISLVNMSFQIRPESQSAPLPYSGVRLPWRTHQQAINVPGRVEGLDSAATSRSLVNRGYPLYGKQDGPPGCVSKVPQPKYTEFATLLSGLFPVSLLTIYKYAIDT